MSDTTVVDRTERSLSGLLQFVATSTSASLQITDAISTSASPSDVSNGQYIFQVLVIVIGVVGTLANGSVLYVLCVSKPTKNQSTVNKLFINQMTLDLFSAIWLVIVYSLKISRIYLSGTFGYYLCVFVVSETIVWYGLVGSSVNLAAIAVERYVMIVHPVWHNNHYSPWMVNSAIAFAWINGILANQVLASTSTVVIDGQCNFGYAYVSEQARAFYGIWYFFSYFCVIISIFVYCYGRIIAVVRRQALTFAAQHINNQPVKAVELRALRTQTNTIKTAITISVLFIACWLPADLYSLIAFTTRVDLAFVAEIYYVTVFVAFFNICLNPFIYAAKYELVRRYWLKQVPWGNNSVSPSHQGAVPISTNVVNVRSAVTSRTVDNVL